jgi:hypothetical protein
MNPTCICGPSWQELTYVIAICLDTKNAHLKLFTCRETTHVKDLLRDKNKAIYQATGHNRSEPSRRTTKQAKLAYSLLRGEPAGLAVYIQSRQPESSSAICLSTNTSPSSNTSSKLIQSTLRPPDNSRYNYYYMHASTLIAPPAAS